jgi:hypothetical protein
MSEVIGATLLYHGHVVSFEWQSPHARIASICVSGESQDGWPVTGGSV